VKGDAMQLKPIHSEADHREALAALERLWGAKPGTVEGDTFEILATLVDAWERQHTPILPPDPIEAIKFRLEQQGHPRKVLEQILGARSRVAEILNGKRKLTLRMIRGLHAHFQIPLEILVAEPGRSAKPRHKGGKRKQSAAVGA
jgi:HTH-type transcriptional regulator/antitoxin HigA